MPYPLLCRGGYPVPEAEGRMEITAINVVTTADGVSSEVILRDIWTADPVNDPNSDKKMIFRSKASGNQIFPVSVKTITGLRAHTLTPNTQVYVYIK